MRLPVILSIDDDEQVLSALRRDLRNHYKDKYQILATSSAKEALDSLQEIKKKGQEVALFLSDQRMPEMLGVDFLEKAREVFPNARRVLLTAYSDIDAAVKAINQVQVHYYLTKPWNPPEEKLFPVLDGQLDDWRIGYVPEEGLKVLGYQFSQPTHQIKDYLTASITPFEWLDVEQSEKGRKLMTELGLQPADLPAVRLDDGTVLKHPTPPELSEKLGRSIGELKEIYDLVIVGAGPAGLAAAVYGGSEGLSTLMIDKRGPGGQAGTSSRIENYLGFPNGVSGAELTNRAKMQAERFGVEIVCPREVREITQEGNLKKLKLDDGTEITAKSVILTTGVDYRQIEAPGAEKFSGAGVYYGSAATEASAFKDKRVYIVGGGNSAGQAAMYLARTAKQVHILIRRDSLKESMSQYLIDQIGQTPVIEVMPFTEVAEVRGREHVECLLLKTTKEERKEPWVVEAEALFVFIGAKPLTDWIQLNILKDDKGFIRTGRDILQVEGARKSWTPKREPFPLETCVPGIFAAGDVRSTAMNRVASAVGEGAQAVSYVHRYLAEL